MIKILCVKTSIAKSVLTVISLEEQKNEIIIHIKELVKGWHNISKEHRNEEIMQIRTEFNDIKNK